MFIKKEGAIKKSQFKDGLTHGIHFFVLYKYASMHIYIYIYTYDLIHTNVFSNICAVFL